VQALRIEMLDACFHGRLLSGNTPADERPIPEASENVVLGLASQV
jgi:hypothetical protein